MPPHALDIAIIESDICGAGASGRNGGCLLTWTTKFFTLRRLFGESEAVRLAQASEQAVTHIGRVPVGVCILMCGPGVNDSIGVLS